MRLQLHKNHIVKDFSITGMNESYYNILYLVIKKEWTYFAELRKIFGISRNYHLDNLYLKGILEKRKPNQNEKYYIKKLNPNTPNVRFEEEMIYYFSEEAYNYFTQPKIYDIVKLFSMDGIDDYIILQREKFNNIKREEEEKKRREEEQFKNMLKNKGWEIENEKNE